MNINNQTEIIKQKNNPGFCSINFEAEGQQLVNNYKCNEKKLTVSDLWHIQKNRREFTRRTSNFVIN